MPLPSLRVSSLALLLVLTGCGGSSGTTEPASATGAADAGVAAANDDAERLAVALESYYRDAGYPRELAGAISSLAGAGLTPEDGNTVAGYVYDDDRVEFQLCVQTAAGAWAIYDTAPMALRRGGPAGGCPKI